MIPSNTPEPNDSIERYLRRLSEKTNLSPAQREDVEREVRAHLELLVADGLAQGLGEDAAIEAALEQFGNPEKLARLMNARGVTWRDWLKKGVAVAMWGVAINWWASFVVGGVVGGGAGMLFGLVYTQEQVMSRTQFLGDGSWIEPVVTAATIVGLLLGILGILPGTAQTSQHGKTLSWRATRLWLGAPWTLMLMTFTVFSVSVSAQVTRRGDFQPLSVVFILVLVGFTVLLCAPYFRAWRKWRLQKN